MWPGTGGIPPERGALAELTVLSVDASLAATCAGPAAADVASDREALQALYHATGSGLGSERELGGLAVDGPAPQGRGARLVDEDSVWMEEGIWIQSPG